MMRTRIAPSPTGDPHVGTAYIALFNYVFSKKNGGKFILRIEDTDQSRSTEKSKDQIIDSLKWLGLSWDEGPDIGGPHGPYVQSQRTDIYAKHANDLLEKGGAFRCFCSSDRLKSLRSQQMRSGDGKVGYDGHCLSLSRDEIDAKVASGEPHVIRMKVPSQGTSIVEDGIRGDIEIPWSQVDMQILLKSDGMPTYHLASVVDDHLMKITHVLRGEEWINSAPKHLRLYEAFGWKAPKLIHLPLLRNPDKSKLSKRKNPTSINYYRKIGVLPETLLNYLGQMAWSMPDGKDQFSIDEMTENFDLNRISLGGPIFDQEKLNWLNGKWIRGLDTDQLAERMMGWMFNPDYLKKILPMLQPRLNNLGDIGRFSSYFLSGHLDVNKDDLSSKKLSPEEVNQALNWGMWRLEELEDWSSDEISKALKDCSKELGVKLRDFLAPFYPAITGMKSATPLFDTIEVLGLDLVRARLRDASKSLGGVSKKKESIWKKAYESKKNGRLKAELESLKVEIEIKDLSGEDLSNKLLEGVNLSGKDLQGTIFRRSKMRKVNLSFADLRFSDLRGADLTGADLTGADLTGAKLEGSIVKDTILDKPYVEQRINTILRKMPKVISKAERQIRSLGSSLELSFTFPELEESQKRKLGKTNAKSRSIGEFFYLSTGEEIRVAKVDLKGEKTYYLIMKSLIDYSRASVEILDFRKYKRYSTAWLKYLKHMKNRDV